MAATIVFVPGFMQRGDAWRAVAEHLGEGRRSVLLDHRAHTFEGRLSEIAAQGENRALVGYSLGGRLALRAVLREPKRYRALVTVGAGAGIEDPDERAARRGADERLAAWIERTEIAQVVARWEDQPVLREQSPELVEAQRPGRLSHEPHELAALLRSTGQGALEPVWEHLPAIDVPVLAIAGEHDAAYVEAAERMASLLPCARAELIAGAGHAPQLERSEAVAALLSEFLDEHLG